MKLYPLTLKPLNKWLNELFTFYYNYVLFIRSDRHVPIDKTTKNLKPETLYVFNSDLLIKISNKSKTYMYLLSDKLFKHGSRIVVHDTKFEKKNNHIKISTSEKKILCSQLIHSTTTYT